MTDTQITRLAALLSLRTAAEALNARVDGMKAENANRAANGLSLAYSGKDFMEVSEELLNFAEQMKKI